MCLCSACCLLSAWSRDNEGLNGGWVQAGTHPFSDTFAQQHAVWLPFVTQIQMWPANKGGSVLCNLEPEADVPNCRTLCLFVLNMSGFLQKAPPGFVWNNTGPEKNTTKGFDILAPPQWLVSSLWWEADCQWLKFGRHAGSEIWFCPPQISCKESWRKKNKRWAARNNVVLSRAQLIVLILLLQACHVPPAAWMG